MDRFIKATKDAYKEAKSTYQTTSRRQSQVGTYSNDPPPPYNQGPPSPVQYHQSPPTLADRGFSPHQQHGYHQQHLSSYGHQQPTNSPYGHQQPNGSPYGHQQPSGSPYGQQNPSASPYGHQQPSSSYNQGLQATPDSLPQLVQSLNYSSGPQLINALDSISRLTRCRLDLKLIATSAGVFHSLKSLLQPGKPVDVLQAAAKCMLAISFGVDQKEIDDRLMSSNLKAEAFGLLNHSNPEVRFLAEVCAFMCDCEKFAPNDFHLLAAAAKKDLSRYVSVIGTGGNNFNDPLLNPTLCAMSYMMMKDDCLRDIVNTGKIDDVVTYFGRGNSETDESVMVFCGLCMRLDEGVAAIKRSKLIQVLAPRLRQLSDNKSPTLDGLCDMFIANDNSLAKPLVDQGFLQKVRLALNGPLDNAAIANDMTFLVLMASGDNAVKHDVLMAIQLNTIISLLNYSHSRIKALLVLYYLAIGDIHQNQAVFNIGATNKIIDAVSSWGLETHERGCKALLAVSRGSPNQRATVLDTALPYYLNLLSLHSVTKTDLGLIPFYGLLVLLRVKENREFFVQRGNISTVTQTLSKCGRDFRYQCFAVIIAATQGAFFGGDPEMFYLDRATPCENFLLAETADWKGLATRLKSLLYNGNETEIMFAICCYMRICWGSVVGGKCIGWMLLEGVVDRVDQLGNHKNPIIKLLVTETQDWWLNNCARAIQQLPFNDQVAIMTQVRQQAAADTYQQQTQGYQQAYQQAYQQQTQLTNMYTQQMMNQSQAAYTQQLQQLQSQYPGQQPQAAQHHESLGHKIQDVLMDQLSDQIQQQLQGGQQAQSVDYSNLMGGGNVDYSSLASFSDPGSSMDMMSGLLGGLSNLIGM